MPAGGWKFAGHMDFYDYWDFDAKPFGKGSGRPILAELKVRIASAALPGQPFVITSVPAAVSQVSTAAAATWAGGTPHNVGDKAIRTAADISAGDVAGGPVGAEIGAQSSEDLNKSKK